MAGANIKEIKRRIKSIESTKQITNAMELVATSKLRKAKEKAEQSRPFFNILYSAMSEIVAHTRGLKSIYTKKIEPINSGYVVIAGDRGLAGGYNTNIFKLVNENAKLGSKIFSIGKKADDFFRKSKYEVYKSYQDVLDNASFIDAIEIAEDILDAYKKGIVDEVHLVYTEFISPLVQQPHIVKVLPLEFDDVQTPKITDVLYDPSPEEVFDNIVPKYIIGMIYCAIVESYASEQGARRTAMEAATDNATEMLDDLNLKFNRARQAAITQELTEIVGGAEAQK